jgi:hypothetical protein
MEIIQDFPAKAECFLMFNRYRLIYLTASVTALFTGVFFYYVLRDFDMIFFQMLKIKAPHANVRLSENFITCFLKYNLCDGLWLLSGILFLRFLWFNNPDIGGYYIYSFIGIALLLELFQLIEHFPGTFDIFDIFTMVFFALLERCTNNFLLIRRQRWVKIG